MSVATMVDTRQKFANFEIVLAWSDVYKRLDWILLERENSADLSKTENIFWRIFLRKFTQLILVNQVSADFDKKILSKQNERKVHIFDIILSPK